MNGGGWCAAHGSYFTDASDGCPACWTRARASATPDAVAAAAPQREGLGAAEAAVPADVTEWTIYPYQPIDNGGGSAPAAPLAGPADPGGAEVNALRERINALERAIDAVLTEADERCVCPAAGGALTQLCVEREAANPRTALADKLYPCGCSATGRDLPDYCPEHGTAPAETARSGAAPPWTETPFGPTAHAYIDNPNHRGECLCGHPLNAIYHTFPRAVADPEALRGALREEHVALLSDSLAALRAECDTLRAELQTTIAERGRAWSILAELRMALRIAPGDMLKRAARVMCTGCADELPIERSRWGVVNHIDVNRERDPLYGYTRFHCRAQPIHALATEAGPPADAIQTNERAMRAALSGDLGGTRKLDEGA